MVGRYLVWVRTLYGHVPGMGNLVTMRQVDKWKDGQTDGRTDGDTDKQTDRWTDRQTSRWTDGWFETRIRSQTDKQNK